MRARNIGAQSVFGDGNRLSPALLTELSLHQYPAIPGNQTDIAQGVGRDRQQIATGKGQQAGQRHFDLLDIRPQRQRGHRNAGL